MNVSDDGPIEETILVGDDLMYGPPSPLIPPEIASHVLQGSELCDGVLKKLFLCLQIHDIEPFCQDEIALYRRCAENRDKELRHRIQESERKLGQSMPQKDAKERASQLQSEITLLERRLILASGIEGMEGFRQRWSLHGRLEDTNDEHIIQLGNWIQTYEVNRKEYFQKGNGWKHCSKDWKVGRRKKKRIFRSNIMKSDGVSGGDC